MATAAIILCARMAPLPGQSDMVDSSPNYSIGEFKPQRHKDFKFFFVFFVSLCLCGFLNVEEQYQYLERYLNRCRSRVCCLLFVYMISTFGLTKYYETVAAVRNVDLYIGAGEICGLIGPNGAGKTTLLKM